MKFQTKMVSILIPVYNREDLIRKTVHSAIKQSYTNIEIVIVDNASTDNTWSVLKEIASTDSRIKIFRNDSNVGPVRNWKACIEKAKGFYGKILWSDDLMSEDAVEVLVNALEKNEQKVAFSYSPVEFITEKGKKTHNFAYDRRRQDELIKSNHYLESLILAEANYPVSPGCALFRLSDLKSGLIETIPCKNEHDFKNIAIGNDLYIFLNTLRKYSEVAYVARPLSYFREHGGSISVDSGYKKLTLFYNLFRAYFISVNPNLFSNKIKNLFFLNVWFFLLRNNTESWGVRSVLDVFPPDSKVDISISTVSKVIYLTRRVFGKIKRC